MMECTFQVGDRVVAVGCGADFLHLVNARAPGQGIGDVFTIASVRHHESRNHMPSGAVITLQEIAGRAFYAFCFRHAKTLDFWIGEKQALKVPA